MNATLPSLGILVNDQHRSLAAPASLLGLLADLGLEKTRGVAAAVNGEVVPRSAWDRRMLADGDKVLLIRATQGG